ncbi:TPA: arginase family protein [Streptococcus suis]|nr:arginase family protein [Streptococcus suis]
MRYFVNKYLCREVGGLRISEAFLEMSNDYADFLFVHRGQQVELELKEAEIQLLINYCVLSKFENYYNLVPNIGYTFFGIEGRCLLEDLNDGNAEKRRVGIIEIPYFQGTLKHDFERDSIITLKDYSHRWPNPNQSLRSVVDKTVPSNTSICDYGFFNINFSEPMLKEVESVVYRIYSSQQVFPIFIGGDHTITYPIIRGINKSGIKKLRLLYFDAHFDISPISQLHNGNVIRKIQENFDGEIEIINFGQRGPLFFEEFDSSRNIKSFHTIGELLEYLKKETSIPIYISVDVDCLDPIYNPGVTYSVPNGLTLSYLENCLDSVFSVNSKILGCDIVEYNSKNDFSKIGASSVNSILFNVLKLSSQIF